MKKKIVNCGIFAFVITHLLMSFADTLFAKVTRYRYRIMAVSEVRKVFWYLRILREI